MIVGTHLGRSRIGYRISISLSGLRSHGAFSRLGLRTRDQFQWVQIALDELFVGSQLGFGWESCGLQMGSDDDLKNCSQNASWAFQDRLKEWD